jgi:hypothetical protein
MYNRNMNASTGQIGLGRQLVMNRQQREIELDELRDKMETVHKNMHRVKSKLFYADARCRGELEENPLWESEFKPYKPVKIRGGLGGAINANVKAIQEEYSQNLNLNKGFTVRQMMSIDSRQKPILDIAQIRKDSAYVEAVLGVKAERAKEAARTPPGSVVSLGSDEGKMVRTRITRRNMAQIGRSALQRRLMERPEMEVEDSEDEEGVDWDPNVDGHSTSSEDSTPGQGGTNEGSLGDVLLGSNRDG